MEPPYGVYRTADGWLAIAQSSLSAIGKVLNSADIARLATEKPKDTTDRAGISAWRDRIYPAVAKGVAHLKTEDAVTAFFAAGVWSGPVNDYAALKEHPQFASYFVTYDHPRAGSITTTAPTIRFSDEKTPAVRGAPALGEHTAEILRGLGYTDAEAKSFYAEGVAA
jgi:crotonobetainyl-CoA:carnitine CoA-transferase CaiB-like acyl-CoA transferase